MSPARAERPRRSADTSAKRSQIAPERSTGTVKWWNATKKYGFIKPEARSAVDLFFHVTGLSDSGYEPAPGDAVEYNVEPDERGPRAVNVAFLDR